MTRVSDAMVRDVVALASDTSLDAVSRLLCVHQISGAPVIDETGHHIGVVSHHDLLDPERPRSGDVGRRVYYRVWNGNIRAVGLVTSTPAPEPGVAADVMSSPLYTIDPEAPVEEAARRMVDMHVHRLFVVDKGRVIGLLTALDCLRAIVGATEAVSCATR